MSSEGKIINKTVAHNIYVQRFAGGKWNDIKFYIADLEKEVTALVTSADFASMTPRLQRQLISKVNNAVSAALKLLDDDLMLGMEEFSEYEIGFTQKMVTSSVKATAVLSAPTLSRNQIRAALESYVLNVEPGNQMTMRVALEKFKVAQVDRLQQTLRDGFISGKTTEQMASQAKEILKTNVINNLKTTAQQAETIVRTATNSTAQMSRDLFYDENPDVITGYKIVATLDSDTTPICQYYDGKKFTLKTDPRPAFHWGCVLPDTLITSASGISSATKRIYKGEVVTINTVSGNELTVTPNHPILTGNGWLPAKLLNIGDQCFNQAFAKGIGTIDSDNNDTFKKASDVFETFFASSQVFSREVEISTPDFHGDGIDNEVAIISTTRDLSCVLDVGIIKHGGERVFKFRNGMRINVALSCLSAFTQFFKGLFSTCSRLISSLGKFSNLFWRRPIHSCLLLFRWVSNVNPVLSEGTLDGTWTDAKHIRNSPDSYAGGVFLDDIVCVKVSYFSGHVYNLQTDDSCYSANGIVTHNCRTTTTPTIADKYNLATGKETRSSATGQVSTKLTYGGWLRQQSVEVQNEVMGVTRAKAFRKGGYSIDRFVDDTGKYYTIEELKVRDLIE